MAKAEIEHGAADQQPGAMLRVNQRQRQDRKPAEGLGPASGDERRRGRRRRSTFYGGELRHHSDQLRKSGQNGETERRANNRANAEK